MEKQNMYPYNAMQYYLAIRSHEILTHAKTWMNIKNIMLREISQSQKVT